jgi:hypothetical protein
VITHRTDVYGDAIRKLPEQFKNKPRIYAWIKSYMVEVQLLEDALWDIFTKRLLQNSPTGDLLDKIGKIVGQDRNGFDDASYLVFISARIKTNRSDGRRETLLAITRLLLPNSKPVVARSYLKAIEVEVNNVSINSFIVWRDFLSRAVAAGDGIRLIASRQDKSHTLTRTSVSGGVTTVSTQRKGSVSAPGGGKFAAVYG